LVQLRRPSHIEMGGGQGGWTLHFIAWSKTLMYRSSSSARIATLGQPPPQQPTGPTYTAKQSATLVQARL
jgi:hypothetical protein